MTLFDSVRVCINKYATFQGRAPRSEYWWFWLFCVLSQFVVFWVFFFIGNMFGNLATAFISGYGGVLLWGLLMFLPSLAVLARRLHDTNHSGWWFFISFVPLIGGIWLFVLLLTGSDEENRYGLPVY